MTTGDIRIPSISGFMSEVRCGLEADVDELSSECLLCP